VSPNSGAEPPRTPMSSGQWSSDRVFRLFHLAAWLLDHSATSSPCLTSTDPVTVLIAFRQVILRCEPLQYCRCEKFDDEAISTKIGMGLVISAMQWLNLSHRDCFARHSQ